MHHLHGGYYSVKPVAVQSPIDVYNSNKRTILEIDSAHFGQVLYIAIAAVQVGSIKMSVTTEDRIKKVGSPPLSVGVL
jgi:phosphatidylserine decarboxylase